MPITQAVTVSYKQQIIEGIHEASDTYKIALYTNAATLDEDTTVYSSTNEVVGAGYVAGGATLSGFSTAIGSGKAWLNFDDPSWASASFTARGALIYNSSQGNKSVMVIAFSGDITVSGGTFSVDLPASGAGTALLRID